MRERATKMRVAGFQARNWWPGFRNRALRIKFAQQSTQLFAAGCKDAHSRKILFRMRINQSLCTNEGISGSGTVRFACKS